MKALGFFQISLLVGIAGLSACGSGAKAPVVETQKNSAPYYRVFRGVKRSDQTHEKFLHRLAHDFIPALPRTHGALLHGYLAVLPPRKPVGLPDEVALVAYTSEADYRAARATPEGKVYGDLHWEVFDRERTKTGGAVPYAGVIERDVAYDVLDRHLDWGSGYSTVYIGARKRGVSPMDFRHWLARHVAEVASETHPRGYVFVASDEFVLAFMNWDSKEAMEAAFATERGKAIGAEAGRYLETRMFQGVRKFPGEVRVGEAYSVPIRR